VTIFAPRVSACGFSFGPAGVPVWAHGRDLVREMAREKHEMSGLSEPQARKFMKMAIRLASGGFGRTSPNPMVGAVVVREGKVVGSGSHQYPGGPHAEVVALERAGKLAKGGVLFVNLEPCSHFGRTPPCVPKIAESGIRAVFASMVDPDPRVRGKGFEFLRRHKIHVDVGLLAQEARELNEAYVKWIVEKRPFVSLKVCESLDGRIAASGGQSRGLGSDEEIRFAHSLRARHDAVLVGVGTVLSDDPRLTVRNARGVNPHRIIIDSRLRTPLTSRILKREADERVIVVSSNGAPRVKANLLRSRGVEVWEIPGKDGRVDLRNLLSRAGRESIQSVLVEGGSDVITSFLDSKLVDKIYVAITPRILGGTQRNSWPKEIGVSSVGRALRLDQVKVRRLGPDVLVEGYL